MIFYKIHNKFYWSVPPSDHKDSLPSHFFNEKSHFLKMCYLTRSQYQAAEVSHFWNWRYRKRQISIYTDKFTTLTFVRFRKYDEI